METAGHASGTVTIRNPTRRWWLLPLVPFTFIGAAMFLNPRATWEKPTFVVLYGLLLVLAVTAFRSRIRFGAAGLEAWTRWRSYRFTWTEIDCFQSRRSAVFVVLHSGRRARLMQWATRWNPSSDDVVAILEDYRIEFHEPGAQSDLVT